MVKYKDFINEFFSGVKVSRLKKEIKEYANYIISKNDSNVEWMSSNLTGVHNIRFSEDDVNRFFIMFNIDHRTMRKVLINKKNPVEGINPKFEVTTIPMNDAIVILASFLVNENISTKDKEEILDDLFFIMAFRMVTSIYSRSWPILADEESAKKTFDIMTQQVDIKRLGYNKAVIDYKSKIFKEGTYVDRLKKAYKDPKAMNDIVVSVSGSIRAWHRYIATLHYKTLDNESKHDKRSVLDKDFEDSGLNDTLAVSAMYYERLSRMTTTRNDLNDIKLLDTIISLYPNAFNQDIKQGLDKIHEIATKHPKKLNEVLEVLVTHSIAVLGDKSINSGYQDRLIDIIRILGEYYANPSNRDESMYIVKNYFQALYLKDVGIKNITRVRNDTVVTSVYLFVISLAIR